MTSQVSIKRYTGQEIIDKIFKYYYKVKIPYLATKSAKELELLGIPYTGIKAIDNYKAVEMITTYITIEQMVELYKKNVDISLLDQKDSIEIYNVITEHIDNWYKFLKTSLNSDTIPIDDLIAMDEFSKKVKTFIHDNNLHLLIKKDNDIFFDTFKNMKNYSVSGIIKNHDLIDIFNNMHNTTSEAKQQVKDSTERTDFFRDKLAILRGL